MNRKSNNNFLSYEGTIDRKNYTINMLIITVLCACLHFVDFSFYFSFTNLKFLYEIFIFILAVFKFVLMFCAISIIYRRFLDITINKSLKVQSNAKKIFSIIYLTPLLLYIVGEIVFPGGFVMYLINLSIIFIFIPISIIVSIALCFIKQFK